MKMKSVGAASVLSLLICLPLAAQVVPSSLENVAGDDNLGILIGHQRPTRYQQVYAGAEVDTGKITAIAFRLDEAFGTTAATCTWTNLRVILSSTTVAVDQLSSSFDANFGADATTVFQGDLVITTTDIVSNPRPFEILIPFTTPFTFDSSSGSNLVVDLVVPEQGADPICLGHPIIDREWDPFDGISSVYCYGGACSAVFDTASIDSTTGVPTLFIHEIFADGFETGNTSEWTSAAPAP